MPISEDAKVLALPSGKEDCNQAPVSLKKKLAKTTLRSLRSCGAFSIAGNSLLRRSNLLILCYHGLSISDEHRFAPHLYITPEVFRQRMQALRDTGASVLPLDEALARLKTGSLPQRSVVITFDDGFFDFKKQAVPILSEFGFPCTLYLTTHYCHYRFPIIDLILGYLLWKSAKRSISLPEVGIARSLPIETDAERQVVVKHLLRWANRKQLSTTAKNEMAAMIAERTGIDYQSILNKRILQILSPGEVKETMDAGIDIQLHTHRHRTPKDYGLFTREIEDNRREIIEFTGKTPSHFCYPSGQYSPEFFRWLQGCGVESATTCDSGLVSRRSGEMKLPRVLDGSGMDLLRFESLLSGLFV